MPAVGFTLDHVPPWSSDRGRSTLAACTSVVVQVPPLLGWEGQLIGGAHARQIRGALSSSVATTISANQNTSSRASLRPSLPQDVYIFLHTLVQCSKTS